MGRNREYKDVMEMMGLGIQIGLTMAGSILLCFLIGYHLDKWLGTKGLFLIIFILLGIVGGGVTVYRQIMDVPDVRKDEDD